MLNVAWPLEWQLQLGSQIRVCWGENVEQTTVSSKIKAFHGKISCLAQMLRNLANHPSNWAKICSCTKRGSATWKCRGLHLFLGCKHIFKILTWRLASLSLVSSKSEKQALKGLGQAYIDLGRKQINHLSIY